MTLTPAMIRALATGEADITAAMPGGIEASEKLGQIMLVRSTNMPIEMHPGQEAFEAAGFKFGDMVDDLFIDAEFPEGWTRTATDHAMHSEISDERGRKRVSIFYKAAFYDRRANARLLCRFTVGNDYGDGRDMIAVTVLDAGNVIKSHPAPIVATCDKNRDHYVALSALEKQAIDWLNAERPDCNDVNAYWDEE